MADTTPDLDQAIQAAMVALNYAVCSHCGCDVPVQPDGMIAIHYLRRRIAGRDRRHRCAGSRHLPRRGADA